MSNKQYDTLKLAALIAVPALAFLTSLCTIWHVPHAEEITATITAVDTLIGATTAIIAKAYHAKEDDTSVR